jgi:hypothetical protein
MRQMVVILATFAFVPLACAQTTAADVRVLLLTPFVDYAFFEPVKKGMQDAAHAMHVEATFDGTKDGNVKALADKVKQAIDAGYDGIAVNMIDPVAFDEVAAEAARKGVPVIAFNVDDSRTPCDPSKQKLALCRKCLVDIVLEYARTVRDRMPPVELMTSAKASMAQQSWRQRRRARSNRGTIPTRAWAANCGLGNWI